jgi:CheY-like chemotaxis protein
MKTQHSTERFTILLADDDKDDRFFFKKAISQLSEIPELEVVTDGEELMNYLKSSHADLPDVIFLDLNMPRKNGVECLTEIKQHEELKDIPVVIYSTSGYDSVAESLYHKGAHYYLQKCDYFNLVNAIDGVLNLLKMSKERPSLKDFEFQCKAQNE